MARTGLKLRVSLAEQAVQLGAGGWSRCLLDTDMPSDDGCWPAGFKGVKGWMSKRLKGGVGYHPFTLMRS